jgi:glycosyltransferase involved in cell wall biosynthesis
MISIIIPVFNSNSTIPKTITSVQNQIFQDFEVIIVNDGSTDNTLETVNQLIKNDARFSIINQKNSGVSTARNIGIKKAKYNIIAFLDSDDEWVETKIEEQINLIKTTNCKAISTNAIRICNEKEDGLYLNYSKQNIKILNILWNNPIILSSTMISKLALISTDLFPEEQKYKAIEDYVLWLKILTNTNFIFLPIKHLKTFNYGIHSFIVR